MQPIYRSDGEWVAVYDQGHLFNVDGEWLGFVVGRELYDSTGKYVGFLSNDRRLLCQRTVSDIPLSRTPPQRPLRPPMPANVPLAPMLPALPYSLVDLFEEYPERFIYISDTRPDME